MTSLILSPTDNSRSNQIVPEWGTNRPKENVPLWSAKSPTWHLRLPKPLENPIGDRMIHQSFPAEHPYSSHISQLKLFPSFAVTSEDPKLGYEARRSQPLTSETPAAPYDIEIVNKIKGFGNRHEVQALPPESLKRGLVWLGDEGFNQEVKGSADHLKYYPIPPTSVVPNIQNRSGGPLAISQRSADTTRNLERQQWKTTYQNNHGGIGPLNQYKLQNLEEKNEFKIITGYEDDNIYPWFTNTYNNPRPQEGRIANDQNSTYGIPTSRGAAQEDTNYVRKPTLTEKEEHRLLNGTEYVSLPSADKLHNDQWKTWDSTNHPDEQFSKLKAKQSSGVASDFVEDLIKETTEEENVNSSYMNKLAGDHHNRVQQVEAQNRWTELELLKPNNDIAVLKRKFNMADLKEQPPVFYGHEGKYNEERAGLYATSYKPEKLSYKLDNDPGKLDLRNTVSSAKDALHYPTSLNLEADILISGSETDPRKVPMFSERPDAVVDAYQRDRHIQFMQLQPNSRTTRVKVEEGGIIPTDSTVGSSYSTEKFLQEYKLPLNVRSEPLSLMSKENQNLENVRVNAMKKVKFNQQVSIAEGAGSTPLLVSKASLENPKVMFYSPRAPTPRSPIRSSPPKLSRSLTDEKNDEAVKTMQRSSEVFNTASISDQLLKSKSLSNMDKLFLGQKNNTPARNLFASKPGTITSNIPSYNMFQTSYNNQCGSKNLEKKQEKYYQDWEPGCGVPRPQTSLLKIQNSFTKSDAYRRLQENFPEQNPNLIDNISKGKKHTFGSLNAQVIRGTMIST